MEPSGGTAMAAGVLAALGAVGQILGGVLDIVLASALPDFGDSTVALNSWFAGFLIVLGVVGLVTGGLLTAGAVLMFRRRPLGRILIVAGCVATIVAGVASYVVLYAGDHGSVGLMGGFGGVIGQVFPVTTAILALVPATGRWLTHVPGQATGYPAPYPGQVPPGYPAPGVPYVDPFRPGPAPYPGQSGTPYPGQPGPGAPYVGQSGPGTPVGGPGPAPQSPPPGAMPYSNEPTPFPEVPPLGAAEESWRRPGN